MASLNCHAAVQIFNNNNNYYDDDVLLDTPLLRPEGPVKVGNNDIEYKYSKNMENTLKINSRVQR